MKSLILRHVMFFRGIEVAVVGVIRRGNKILLTKRSNWTVESGKWCLPGGHVEKWETIENALKREIREEIGLKIQNKKFVNYHNEFVKRLNMHVVTFVFEIKTRGKIKNNFEVSESNFFDEKEIKKLNMAFDQKSLILKYLKDNRK